MTEEEKKAIEDLKNIVTDLEDTENGAIISLTQEEIDSLKIILNLINNQQKEIEKLKEKLLKEKRKNKRYETYLKNKDKIYNKTLEYLESEKEKEYISKDKIREIVNNGDDEWYEDEYIIAVRKIRELLEE